MWLHLGYSVWLGKDERKPGRTWKESRQRDRIKWKHNGNIMDILKALKNCIGNIKEIFRIKGLTYGIFCGRIRTEGAMTDW